MKMAFASSGVTPVRRPPRPSTWTDRWLVHPPVTCWANVEARPQPEIGAVGDRPSRQWGGTAR